MHTAQKLFDRVATGNETSCRALSDRCPQQADSSPAAAGLGPTASAFTTLNPTWCTNITSLMLSKQLLCAERTKCTGQG
jgi:hypothetical protein